MMETRPTAKAGLIKPLAPHKRVLSNNTRLEVEQLLPPNMELALTKVPPLEELQDKESELPLKLKAGHRLETEVLLQTQVTLPETTSLEVELLLNKKPHKTKKQLALP